MRFVFVFPFLHGVDQHPVLVLTFLPCRRSSLEPDSLPHTPGAQPGRPPSRAHHSVPGPVARGRQRALQGKRTCNAGRCVLQEGGAKAFENPSPHPGFLLLFVGAFQRLPTCGLCGYILQEIGRKEEECGEGRLVRKLCR